MGVATKPRCTVVFLMILTLGMSLGLPAEDVLDAVYDESEALPYEGTPLFSIAVPQASARIAKPEMSRDFLLRFRALTKRCQRRRENCARSHGAPDSLIIIRNHSFRC